MAVIGICLVEEGEEPQNDFLLGEAIQLLGSHLVEFSPRGIFIGIFECVSLVPQSNGHVGSEVAQVSAHHIPSTEHRGDEAQQSGEHIQDKLGIYARDIALYPKPATSRWISPRMIR